VEKRGVPTVTITTTAFADLVKSTMDEHAIAEMAIVTVEHPIAGRNAEDTKKFVDAAFSDIFKAATSWQPTK